MLTEEDIDYYFYVLIDDILHAGACICCGEEADPNKDIISKLDNLRTFSGQNIYMVESLLELFAEDPEMHPEHCCCIFGRRARGETFDTDTPN